MHQHTSAVPTPETQGGLSSPALDSPFIFSRVTLQPLLQGPPASLPCISAFLSLTSNVWSFSAFLNTAIFFISGKVCAVCIASLLLAQAGTADVITGGTLEAGGECSICFFCVLSMLHATAHVKERNTPAAFRILNLWFKAKMKYSLSFQVSAIQGINHTAARTRTTYILHIIFGFAECQAIQLSKFCVELWHLRIAAFFSWIPTQRPNDHHKQNLDNIECELYGASWTAHLSPPTGFLRQRCKALRH